MMISGWFTCFNAFNSFWHFCECEIVGIDADFYSAYSSNKENENGGSPFHLFTEEGDVLYLSLFNF